MVRAKDHPQISGTTDRQGFRIACAVSVRFYSSPNNHMSTATLTVTRKGRRRFAFGPIIVVTLVLALTSAVLCIPIRIGLMVVAGIAFAGVIWKFVRDNRRILAGAGIWSLLRVVPTTLIISLPFVLVLIPGFALSFAVDYGLDAAVQYLDKTIAPKTESIFKEFTEPYPFYDPRGWFTNDLKKGVKEVKVLKEAPLHMRIFAGTVRQLVEIARWYLFIYFGYVCLRVFCFFFARAYVSRGGRIVFCLAPPSP
jgi:hypothetical protein